MENKNQNNKSKYIYLVCEDAYGVDTQYGKKILVKFNKSLIARTADEVATVKTDYFLSDRQAFIESTQFNHIKGSNKTTEIKMIRTYAQWLKENKGFHYEGVEIKREAVGA